MTIAGMSVMEMVKLFAPLIVAELALKVYCLASVARTQPRLLPKWAWAAIIVIVSGFGSIAYLLFGRARE